MKLKIITLFILYGTLFSCKNKERPPSFKKLFYHTFSIIKKEYIKTEELNWTEIEGNIKDSIPKFQNHDDVYNGIKYVLYQIKDKHSFFLTGNHPSNFSTKDSIIVPEVPHKILKKNIGYLKILGFAANDSISSLYSIKIREALLKIDNQPNLSGWIIDLRNNKGGMLGTFPLGLSPLYTNTIIGYSVNNKGEYINHKLSNNTYYYGNKAVSTIKLTDSLININKPIAILVNDMTASSGESTAQSFKFQVNTLIFGTKTSGFTTDLMVYDFSPSGALLGLSTTFMCDQNKNELEKGIVPDIQCESEKSLELAIEWIQNAI